MTEILFARLDEFQTSVASLQAQINAIDIIDDANILGLSALSTATGFVVETANGSPNTFTQRSIIGTANELTVTNGNGVAGNPTLSLPAALTFTGKTITGGTFNAPTLVTPALGTPASGILTNGVGLPISTGLTGAGTGVLTALAVNIGLAGAFVTFNGALGTPSSGVGTNLTGTAAGFTAGNVTTNANLTGPITSIGNATSVASQTGTGSKFVMDTNPTFSAGITVTTNISAGTVNNIILTNSGTTATLSLLSATTITFQGTDTYVGRATTDTLTNKSIAAAQLTGTLAAGQFPALTGDITTVAGALATTLASVATAGTTGSSTAIPIVTIDVKGRVTGISTAAVIGNAGTLNGTTLNSTVVTSSLTSLGTITTLNATTINAFTQGGNISGGGFQHNNVIIGASTPLAGTFTTITGNTSLTSPLHIGGSGTTGTQLTLQTTSGVGTTDQFLFTGGNNGGTTFGLLNSSGLVIGSSAPGAATTIAGAPAPFAAISVGAIVAGLRLPTPASIGAQVLLASSRGASFGTFSAVQAADGLGGFIFQGDNGTTYLQRGATIRAATITNWSGVNNDAKLVFSTTATGALTTTDVMVIANTGLGYATGIGGAVTQATNRTTGVTLNTPSGAITLFSQVNTAVSAATAQSFTVTNSSVGATDTIIMSQKSGTDLYEIFVTAVSAGSFKITNYSTGGTTNEAPVFNFNVIKGVTS